MITSGGNRRGFTLIELLVVIAIIAILAAILFPIFANAKERGRQAKCLNNLKQLAMAAIQYSNDNAGRLPLVWNWTSNWGGYTGDGTQAGAWCYPEKGQIWPYTKTRGIYMCPSDQGRPALMVVGDAKNPAMNPRNYPLSYSMNWILGGKQVDSMGAMRISRMLMFIHEDRGSKDNSGRIVSGINDGIFLSDKGNPRDIPDHVHYDGTTVAYADGHARWGSQRALMAERDQGYWTAGQ